MGAAFSLAVLFCLLAFGFAVQVHGEQATLGSLSGPRCLLRHFFGEPACPGCGLTRASSHLLHGNLGQAWRTHAGSFALICTFAVWIGIHTSTLLRGRRSSQAAVWHRFSRRMLIIGVALGWLLRNLHS